MTTQRAAGVSPLKRVLFHQHFLCHFCAGLQHSATFAYDVCSLGPQSRLDVIRVHVIKPDIRPTRKPCLKRTVWKLESPWNKNKWIKKVFATSSQNLHFFLHNCYLRLAILTFFNQNSEFISHNSDVFPQNSEFTFYNFDFLNLIWKIIV